MTATIIFIELILLVVVLAFVFGLRLRRAGRIVVTTKQGDSFRGRRRPTFRLAVVIEEAEELGSGLRLPGRVEVPRENVGLIQRLPAEETQHYAATPEVPARRVAS